MNHNSGYLAPIEDPADTKADPDRSLYVDGGFVRGHSVARVLKQRWPNRGPPVDVLTTSLCATLVDYMPGVRSASLGLAA